jgi:ribonucleoside-triphosphate reductase
MLEDAGIAYEKIDADEAPELVAQFGIRQAPTLVVIKDGQATVYANASNIVGFIEEI